jgi:hypothetical protein
MFAVSFTAKTGCRHAAVWERKLCSNLKPQRRLRSNRPRCWNAPCGTCHRYPLALALARGIHEAFLDPVARHPDKAPLPGAGCMPPEIERGGELRGHADRLAVVRTARCRQRGEQNLASTRTAQNLTRQTWHRRRVRACRRRSFIGRECVTERSASIGSFARTLPLTPASRAQPCAVSANPCGRVLPVNKMPRLNRSAGIIVLRRLAFSLNML